MRRYKRFRDRAAFARMADNTRAINIRPFIPRGGIRL